MSEKKDSIRSPLSRARGLGSAHDGVHHWWMQRVSAVALVLLIVFLLCSLGPAVKSYATLASWLAAPLHAVALLLFIFAAFYHATLGMQVIIEDYVHCATSKLSLLLLNKFFFFFAGATAAYAVILINFGR